MEKFISELFNNKNELKVYFSQSKNKKIKQIKKMLSLLFLVKRESDKILSHVLAIAEYLYSDNKVELKHFLRSIIISETKQASDKNSAFETVWYIFFSRYVGLGIDNFNELITNQEILHNQFVQSVLQGKNILYKDTEITLFRTPKNCNDQTLVNRLDIFQRTKNRKPQSPSQPRH